ncbi:MAG: CoA pyrophosphatase [Gammaproteobacteria bacterium]|nr:CoA pyrophosphatase [Gammaproteobacteria bacterium]
MDATARTVDVDGAVRPHELPVAALRQRLRERLAGTASGGEPRLAHFSAATARRLRRFFTDRPVPAAVLVPIIDRGEELTVLLTERSSDLKHHAGQIAFPGGRLEPDDPDVVTAALRETEEEIGLPRDRVEVLGFLPDHPVITGYRITPVVGLVQPQFELLPDPLEVAGTFEAPLRRLLNPAADYRHLRQWEGEVFETYDLLWQEHRIWGVTAGMLLTLRELLGGSYGDAG